MKTILIFTLMFTQLMGCSILNSNESRSLLNPHKIHDETSQFNKSAYAAAAIPIDDYYKALELAKTKYTEGADPTDPAKKITTASTPASKEAIIGYVGEGLGLVNSYCRRWFQEVDDRQRLLSLQDRNVNVITQLGTVLLGIGKANANIITGYGASNIAYAGFSENFNGAFLASPSTTKVREHIETVMKDEAVKLIKDAQDNNLTFKQAYNRLEVYAGFCTHAQAKQIVNNALDLSQTNSENGHAKTTSIAKPVKQASDPDTK